jgi:hypothetical protein
VTRWLTSRTHWAVAKRDGTVLVLCDSESEAREFIGESPGLDIVKVRRAS